MCNETDTEILILLSMISVPDCKILQASDPIVAPSAASFVPSFPRRNLELAILIGRNVREPAQRLAEK